jgi:hypothetical protein
MEGERGGERQSSVVAVAAAAAVWSLAVKAKGW